MSGALLRRLSVAVFFVSLLLLALHELHAFDIWWQIAAGEWILAHGLPSVDPFSYGFPDGRWIEPRWLFCLAVAKLWAAFGATGLILFKLALLGATFAVLLRTLRPRAASAWLLAGAVALVTMQARFLVRPELVSYLFLALTLGLWTRFRDTGNPQPLWALPFVQLLWCNAHTLWILGPVAQWLLVLGETLRRRGLPRGPALVALASSVAALANPWGVAGALNPLRLFRQIGESDALGSAIHEFRSPFSAAFFDADFATIGFLAAIAVSAAAFLLRPRKIDAGRLLVWAAFLFLAVRAERNVALFGLVACWATMRNLDECCEGERRPYERTLVATLAAGMLVWAALAAADVFYRATGSTKRFGFGVSQRYPVDAVAAARAGVADTRIFHALGDGGYVLWEGGQRSAYVDGRLEVYDPDELLLALAATTNGDTCLRELARTGANRVVMRIAPAHLAPIATLERDPSWLPIFHDPWHVVYARRDTLAPGAAVLDWRTVAPHADDAPGYLRLAQLYAALRAFDRAALAWEKALELAPHDATARLYLGLYRRAEGDESAAEELLRGVPSERLEDPGVRRFADEMRRIRGS